MKSSSSFCPFGWDNAGRLVVTDLRGFSHGILTVRPEGVAIAHPVAFGCTLGMPALGVGYCRSLLPDGSVVRVGDVVGYA